MNSGLSDFTAQCDAAAIPGFSALHANDIRVHAADQLVGNGAARTGHLAHIHRYAKVLAADAARKARIGVVVRHIGKDPIIVLYIEQLNGVITLHLENRQKSILSIAKKFIVFNTAGA